MALAAAFAMAVLATPAGISGGAAAAVSGQRAGHAEPVGHADQPAVQRGGYPWRAVPVLEARADGRRLALALIAGTLPGVVAGSVIGVELLPGDRLFDFVVAGVLLPLGLWLALTSIPGAREARPTRAVPAPALIALAVAVGCVGGIYGIGGGSTLAPVLIGTGRQPKDVAPAALASTFVTSVAGVVTFAILSIHHQGSVSPDWPTGIALGIGAWPAPTRAPASSTACRTG